MEPQPPNPNKDIRIRIEAPQPAPVEGPRPLVQSKKEVSKFFYCLALLTFVCAGLSLYLSFLTH